MLGISTMLKTDSRRIFRLPTSSHLFAMVTVALIISGFARQSDAAADRPNIILIMADDKCYSLIGRDSESRKIRFSCRILENRGFRTTDRIDGNCGEFRAINYTLLHLAAVPLKLDTSAIRHAATRSNVLISRCCLSVESRGGAVV